MAASAAARQLDYGTDYDAYGSAGPEHARKRDLQRQDFRYGGDAAPAGKEQAQTGAHRHVQVCEKRQISVAAVLGFSVVMILAALVLISSAQLYVFSRQVSEAKSSLEELETEYTQLMGQYDTIYDSATVQAAAEAAGMRKPGSGQIFYVDLSGGDSAEVLQKEQEESTLADEVVSAAEDKISAMTEYLN